MTAEKMRKEYLRIKMVMEKERKLIEQLNSLTETGISAENVAKVETICRRIQMNGFACLVSMTSILLDGEEKLQKFGEENNIENIIDELTEYSELINATTDRVNNLYDQVELIKGTVSE